MLLRELLIQLGINASSFDRPPPFSKGSNPALRVTSPHSLDQIGQFEFGERYCVVLLSGMRVDVRQLDTILGVIKSEFLLAETYDLTLHVGGGKKKNLILRPKAELGRPWGRNVAKTCKQIEDWVTIYNLPGEWPEEAAKLYVPPYHRGIQSWI